MSRWELTPELIVVAVGFVAFVAYLWQERRNGQRRAASLPTSPVDGRQWLTVTLLVVAGLAHLPVISDHLREAPYMGVLFIAFTAAAFVLAVAIAADATPARYAAAVALAGPAIGAYVATRLVAFPQLADDVGAWREPLGVLCVIVEAAVVVTAGLEWRRLTDRGDGTSRLAAS